MRRGVIAFAAVLIAGTFAGRASANNQAFLYWNKAPGPTDIAGVRSSIGNPSGTERTVNNPDFFLTTVEANNGATSDSTTRGLQQGVLYVNGATVDPYQGTCQYHSAMFYFVEIDNHDSYSCYYEGAASAGSHVEKVQRDSSGNWWGYLDGVQQTVASTSWTLCGGYACVIAAFAEELNSLTGYWQAKFSGSGNTDWGFYNGSAWSAIDNYSGSKYSPDSGLWTANLSGFPDNLWYFVYSK